MQTCKPSLARVLLSSLPLTLVNKSFVLVKHFDLRLTFSLFFTQITSLSVYIKSFITILGPNALHVLSENSCPSHLHFTDVCKHWQKEKSLSDAIYQKKPWCKCNYSRKTNCSWYSSPCFWKISGRKCKRYLCEHSYLTPCFATQVQSYVPPHR